MSKGVTNAIYKPTKVLAHFKGKYYKTGSGDWYLCLDSDQIASFQEFMSDMDKMIGCYATATTTKCESLVTPWAYTMMGCDSNLNGNSGVSPPSLTGTMIFFNIIQGTGNFAKTRIEIKWNASGSGIPTQASNTYAVNTMTSYAQGFSSNGTVGYLSMIKIV